jgi:hypothetical protein
MMDPDASLTEIQQAAQDYYEALIIGDLRTAEQAATRMADRFCALDDWLQCGGYLPKLWQHRGTSGPE